MENSITPVEPSPKTEPEKNSAAAVHVPRYSYYALTVLTLVNFLNYIDRQVLPAVAPAMRKELGLSQTEIGFLEDALFPGREPYGLRAWVRNRRSAGLLFWLADGVRGGRIAGPDYRGDRLAAERT